MELPVLIESTPTHAYRATTGMPLALTAEGATREEALTRLQQAVEARLRTGAEFSTLNVAATVQPLTQYAGMFKDNPLFEAWQQAIEDNRRQDDAATEDR